MAAKPKTKPSKPSKPKSSPKPSARKPVPRRAGAARIGDNTLEGRAQPYMKRIESLMGDLDSERGAYMAKCKPIHEDIREVYAEAKDNGVPVKALKGLVKWREFEKKQAKIGQDFADLDEKASYDQLIDTLGPLGFAAARAAGYADNDDHDTGDQRDVRPRHMTQPDAQADGNGAEPERADEAELARVGRGRDPEPAPEPAEPPVENSESPPTTH